MKSKPFKALFIFSLLIIVFIVTLSSSLFFVTTINIDGNSRVTDEEILELAQLAYGDNIFTFNKIKAERQILKNNYYIEEVSIDKKIFRKEVDFTIKERNLIGYIEYETGNYLFIDETGLVIETSTFFTEKLPVIVGLECKEFEVGEVLIVEEQEDFEKSLYLINLLYKYGILSEILKIDVTDINDIHIYTKNLDVNFGSLEDAEEKVIILEAIMENIPNEDMNYILDIKDISKPPLLKIVT